MKISAVLLIALVFALATVEGHKGKLSHKNKAHAKKNAGWEKIFGQAKLAGKKVIEKVDEAMRFIKDIKSKQDGS